MGLVNTREFQTIGIIVGVVFVIGVIYMLKLLNNKSAHTQKVGGRRKRLRLRQIRKKRR